MSYYLEAIGRGWEFVPIPGIAPLPREIEDDEYFPLHVGLFPDTYPENCSFSSYPHKHICFTGDDGNASIWAPIESRPFLDYVLDRVFTTQIKGDLYGAKIEHVRMALEPLCKELFEEITSREQALIDDPAREDVFELYGWFM
ncbi:hypothetical protein FJY93_01940 [Candidatus Kaiserbacteria bacterium]|nr:hypothetical protein [Candidatus Kaiserbacteria bacterium]